MNEVVKKLSYIPYTAWRQVKWLAGDRSPFAATLKLTTRCTLKCRHCPWLDSETEDLPTQQWKEIIDKTYSLGARHLVMEGGEPTLRDDLNELIKHGQKKGMNVTLATNATRDLSAYTPDRFLVSVDGLEQTHDSIRGKGAFKRMKENLSSATSPTIALVSLSRENRDEIEEVLKYFTPLLDGFWFSFVYDYDCSEKLSLSPEEKKAAAKEIQALMNSYPIINKPSYLRRVGTKRQCRDWLLYTVTADGTVHKGCMVEAIDDCRCDDCELACHREFSDFLDPRLYPYHFIDYLIRLLQV